MRSIIVGLLVVGLGTTVSAQNPSRLDEPIGSDFRIDHSLLTRPCAIGTVANQIARNANVPLGVENTPKCELSARGREASADSEVLTGMTTRQAFDHLLGFMPSYSWQEMDGVVIIRPKSAWNDPRNPLNLPTAPFSATNAHLDSVLHMLLQAVRPPLFYPHVDVPQPVRPIDRPVDVVFPGGTMLAALNAMIRSQEGEWELGYGGNHATIVLRTLEFGRGSVMAPLALPHAR